MQSKSIFDANTFLETTQKGGLDTAFVLPDPGDYPAQVTDKPVPRSGIIGEGKGRAGEPWASVDIQWEIMDDSVRTKLNMERVLVRQSLMLDLIPNTGLNGVPPQLDLGTNKNMRLKRLLDATGLNKQKQWSLGSLQFQQGLIKVEHRDDPNDSDIKYAEVVRVSSLSKRRESA